MADDEGVEVRFVDADGLSELVPGRGVRGRRVEQRVEFQHRTAHIRTVPVPRKAEGRRFALDAVLVNHFGRRNGRAVVKERFRG